MADQSAEHFQDLTRQAHAARLGMWVFLASEVLFFAGLFGLYATYRVEHPVGFGEGVLHNTLALGSTNTAVLLVSSYTIALAVHELRRGMTRAAAALTAATIFLGLCFLGIKAVEYTAHFREGIYPGGAGAFFPSHPQPGIAMFFTLYFCMTGLHAIHVIAGMCVLGFLLRQVLRGRIGPARSYPLAVGAVYWHLVDAVWIFLWPLFYLVPGVSAMTSNAEGASARGLLLTWAVLMALAALSLGLRFAHLGRFGMVAALAIAAVKAVLVGLVFMELAFERASIRIAFAAGLFMIVVMLALMIGDVVTRAVPPLENPPGTEQRSYG